MSDPDAPNFLDQLLPDRHPQADFFICDVADAVLKDLIPQMEHPFYALSKKPDTAIRRYEHEDKWIEVIPSVKGQATIYDKDILIYAVSQIMTKLNRGERVERRLRFNLSIPRACGHRFHEHVAIDSTNMWPLVPRHVATPLR